MTGSPRASRSANSSNVTSPCPRDDQIHTLRAESALAAELGANHRTPLLDSEGSYECRLRSPQRCESSVRSTPRFLHRSHHDTREVPPLDNLAYIAASITATEKPASRNGAASVEGTKAHSAPARRKADRTGPPCPASATRLQCRLEPLRIDSGLHAGSPALQFVV